MELLTVGDKNWPGRQVLLWYNPQETLSLGFEAKDRFRLIFVEKGSGIVNLGNRRMAFNAPVLLCVNECEMPIMEQSVNIQATGLYFHPSVINSAFSFENVRGGPDDMTFTDTQDRYWLQPFVDRSSNHNGLYSLAPITAGRTAYQMALIDRQLSEQPDGFWPCRSRSYFLELLFLVDRLYRDPDIAEIGALSQVAPDEEISDVILYLHTHYHEKITIPELARNFHTNRTTLTRQFHAVTGLPIMTYLINLRVHLASLMLRNTTVPVMEVRQRVGFVDDTHFTRTFRKYTRSTPSEYRQRYCWMLQ